MRNVVIAFIIFILGLGLWEWTKDNGPLRHHHDPETNTTTFYRPGDTGVSP